MDRNPELPDSIRERLGDDDSEGVAPSGEGSSKREREETHPVIQGFLSSERLDTEALARIASGVPWTEFSHMQWDQFRRVKLLAMLDLFTDFGPARKALVLSIPSFDLDDWRELSEYGAIAKRLREETDSLAVDDHLDDQAILEKASREAMRELRGQIGSGSITSYRRLAAQEILDRTHPKPSRSSDAKPTVIVLGSELMEALDGAKRVKELEVEREQRKLPSDVADA